MITAHAYKTFQGETRVLIAHSFEGTECSPGMPGTRTTLLSEPEARRLLKELGRELAQVETPDADDTGE